MTTLGPPATRPLQPARLSVLIARKARKAVVFRRGPSHSVLALTWDLASDALTPGQWFRGRIYERRCDLSPDGELLVYFAGYRGQFRSWTAISRPPYFTALALWPKGDGWGGGGLFSDGHSLWLNHRPETDEWALNGDETRLAPGFSVPSGFRVSVFGERPGWGEDDPIYTARQERDGWRLIEPSGAATDHGLGAPLRMSFDPPGVIEKPLRPEGSKLCVTLHGLHERDGRWYVETSKVMDPSGELQADLGRTDWADIDHNGDVLYGQEGRLFRIRSRGGKLPSSWEPKLVADLNDYRYQRVTTPAEATVWPKLARSALVEGEPRRP